MVIGIARLPATGWPVMGSKALTVTLVEYDVPPGTPVALTMTLSETLAPPRRFVPAPAESETKEGAPAPSAAVQFSDSPPVLLMLKA